MNVVITGASAGIGASCARVFAEHGANLALGARRLDRLEDLGKEISHKPGQVNAFHLDVSDEASVEEFCSKTLESFSGKVDVLINNAGLALGREPLVEGEVSEWRTVLDTNVLGVLNVTRHLLPQMQASGAGHLIFLSSIAAHQVYEGGAVYCATKHAIDAIARTLKLELNGTGIRVSTLDPGMVETEFSEVRFRGDKQAASDVYKGINALSGNDIAECALFIATRPAHVNIDQMIIMPSDQATVYKMHRT